MSESTELGTLQAAALNRPEQAKIEELRGEIVALKLRRNRAIKRGADPSEFEALLAPLLEERAELAAARDAELTEYKARDRDACLQAEVDAIVEAAQEFVGLPLEKLDAIAAEERAKFLACRARRQAIAAAREVAIAESELQRAVAALSPIQRAMAVKQGLL